MASRCSSLRIGALVWLLAPPCLSRTEAASGDLAVATSEPVLVAGSPRIAVDVGDVTRGCAVKPEDFDASGITIASPLHLRGSTIIDAAGNADSPLTFTLPDTPAIKAQSYTAAFTTSPITDANANAVSFVVAKAPAGATGNYPMTSRRRMRPRSLRWLATLFCLFATPAAAATLSFTVTTTKPVTVMGTPSIPIDVGGASRVATYKSGSGSNALTFSYTVQPGDFDADGITITTPGISLNDGSIVDLSGNPLSNVTFTAPDTTGITVQTYRPAIPGGITTSNANAAGFTIGKLPSGPGYSYSYTISGSNGGTLSASNVSYSGSSVAVSNLDLSSWPMGNVTLTVTVTGPSGQGQPVSVTVTPSDRPLDSFPAAASAYSVRQLRSAYTGPLMRVRRASDNAQQNIGATMAGTLDTSALAGFCGSASCFVTRWYDQSGSFNDAVQAAPANQPRIAVSGAVERNGAGKIALRTLSITNVLNAGAPMATSAEFTVLMSMQTAAIASQWAWGMTRWPGQVSSNCPWSDGLCYFDVGSISGPARIAAVSGITPGTPYVATFGSSVSASTQYIRLNGVPKVSDATGHSVPLEGLSIMNNYEYNGGANNLGQIGTVSEFVIFPSLLSSANQTALENSMKAAHGP